MKSLAKSVGVALLEIMLVLAIVVMIVVMSIRYYSSSAANSQATAVLRQIQMIAAAADQLTASTGSYSAAGVNPTTLAPLLPPNSFTTPWDTEIELETVGSDFYEAKIKAVPPTVCPLVIVQFAANPHYQANSLPASFSPGSCPLTTQDITWRYCKNNSPC